MSRRSVFIPLSVLAVPVATALLLGGGCERYPSTPSEPVIGTPPTTTGAPSAPAPPAEVYGCGLPRGRGLGRDCPREHAHFMDAINIAIDRTMQQHPEWFQGHHVRDGHVGHYVDETVENLRKMGYCALNDGEEVAIKNSNDFSDQYDIISAGGNVLRAYMATCRPAWDAIPPAGDGS